MKTAQSWVAVSSDSAGSTQANTGIVESEEVTADARLCRIEKGGAQTQIVADWSGQ